jgi:hypothetical protein
MLVLDDRGLIYLMTTNAEQNRSILSPLIAPIKTQQSNVP